MTWCRNELIEDVLEKYRPAILDDYDHYRTHVHRVFSTCLLLDSEAPNREKYAIAVGDLVQVTKSTTNHNAHDVFLALHMVIVVPPL